jgi:hypothetical protein
MAIKLDHLQQLHLTPFETPKGLNVYAGVIGVGMGKISKFIKK